MKKLIRWEVGVFLIVVGLAVLGFVLISEDAKNRRDQEKEIIELCVAAGKSWTHNDNGWGECK